MIDFRKVLRSFRFAGQGILDLFRYENNAKVHLLVAGAVMAVGLWLQFTITEWAIILTQIGLVWAAEAVNTAIERLCDVVSPAHHPTIGKVKDMAAGAVLIVVIMAVIIGLLIIGMKLTQGRAEERGEERRPVEGNVYPKSPYSPFSSSSFFPPYFPTR